MFFIVHIDAPLTSGFRTTNQIVEKIIKNMGIKTTNDYVKFYINLNIHGKVSLLSFIHNEKMVLKQKIENKKLDKEPIINGIKILEDLIEELKKDGESKILEKYNR
ncbi:hypothetical protein [Nitrosarchaeum sp. AC2]|uniref:hypothetical protein n=1 Tax=Nitrosarchaeum sp. AC2 TaxID=2259673 RepID=UPI0021029EA6|nr:hypothetical protein [Nitrosarchaeum sp. AC2]